MTALRCVEASPLHLFHNLCEREIPSNIELFNIRLDGHPTVSSQWHVPSCRFDVRDGGLHGVQCDTAETTDGEGTMQAFSD